MELLVIWAGFIGAWLLVAGPLYQAVLELKDQDIEIERIRSARGSIAISPKVSVWWWLLPPIKVLLERRRSLTYRRAHFKALSAQDQAALIAFIDKATAWLFVALGGFSIAIKETFELAEALELKSYAFWLIIAGMTVVCALNTAFRISRSERALARQAQ